MQKDSWAGDADGFLPWTRAELEKSGQTLPTPAPYYSDSGELLFEQILNAAPDLILAPYSGFSEQDYQRLSSIAPTLPYDTKPYQQLVAKPRHRCRQGTRASRSDRGADQIG